MVKGNLTGCCQHGYILVCFLFFTGQSSLILLLAPTLKTFTAVWLQCDGRFSNIKIKYNVYIYIYIYYTTIIMESRRSARRKFSFLIHRKICNNIATSVLVTTLMFLSQISRRVKKLIHILYLSLTIWCYHLQVV